MSFSVSLGLVLVMYDCFGTSVCVCVCVCVWKRGRGTHRDGERWGEKGGGQEETMSPADFQLLCFSPSVPGSSFPSCSLSPLTWSPCLPCERIDPHCVFHIFLIPPPRSRALGKHDVPHLVVWPDGGEWGHQRAFSRALTSTQFNGLIWLMLLKSHLHLKMAPVERLICVLEMMCGCSVSVFRYQWGISCESLGHSLPRGLPFITEFHGIWGPVLSICVSLRAQLHSLPNISTGARIFNRADLEDQRDGK